LNPVEHSHWDAFLATHPGASFFHSAAWAKVLHETYGYEPVYFTVSEDKRLLALLPVMEVNSWLTGRRGVSLPFTDACEPLDHDASFRDSIIPEAIEHGRRRGWKYLEYRG